MGFALLNFTTQMSDIECCSCHAPFAVTHEAHVQLRQTGKGFWCPLCGTSQSYHDSENSRLKKRLEEAERQREWHKSRAADERAARERVGRRLTAQRGATKRLKNRVKNGVCPCCTRSFGNLREHMKRKHPEYVASDKADPEALQVVA